MKNKKRKKSENELLSMKILGKVESLPVDASDERLFNVIKKEVPEVQENSLYEVNFYTIADTKDKAAKCAALITQGIAITTKYQGNLIINKFSDDFNIVVSFMEFPFNLDEIKKCSKFISDCATKIGCVYDSWEVGFKSNKK